MTAKYSIDGEIDVGWRSYWPPEEQPSDESAESDTDASDRDPANETTAMSDTDAETHDDELPVYATEPEQGEITTEGEPMTDLEREIKAVANDLGEYRSETKPNDRKAIALTRLNPELSPRELAEQFDLGDYQTIRQANRKMEHAMLETQSDIKDALSELSDRQYAVVGEKARDPSQTKAEMARTLDIPNGTANTYANRFGVLAAKARDFGISFDRDANIESANYTGPKKNQAAVRDMVENADEPLTASAIAERASVAARSARRHLNQLTEDGILTELPPGPKNRAKRWSSDGQPLDSEDDNSTPTDEDAQKPSEDALV